MKSAPEKVKSLRESERAFEIADSLRAVSLRMSLPLYLLFWIADIFFYPDYIWTFLGLRLLTIPVNVFTHQFAHRFTSLAGIQRYSLIYAAFNSIPITVMLYLAKDPSAFYYEGLNLTCLGLMTFVPVSLPYLVTMGSIIYLPFYVFLFWFPEMQTRLILLHSFFGISSVVAALLIRNFTEKLRLKEASSRIDLKSEIESRERVIQEQTIEGIFLRHLSSQFSPQVVEAVAEGKVNLIDAGSLRLVAVGFVDIVGSTKKSNQLNPSHFTEILDEALGKMSDIALAHDITIDKMTGDGIMLLSNVPIASEDFGPRMIRAIMEIQSQIEAWSPKIESRWLGPFELHAGIAVGVAHVGFRGKDVKSYTAVGSTPNLASRLCSESRSGELLVNKETIAQIRPNDQIKFEKIDRIIRLKGFEEPIAVYVIGTQRSRRKTNSNQGRKKAS